MKKIILLVVMLCTAPAAAAEMAAVATDAPAVTDKTKAPEMIDYFGETHKKMRETMKVESTGNVDIDFAKAMIVQYQGSVEMARTHLKYSKDAGLRAMSENLIKAQEPEIKRLQDWLAAHEKN